MCRVGEWGRVGGCIVCVSVCECVVCVAVKTYPRHIVYFNGVVCLFRI